MSRLTSQRGPLRAVAYVRVSLEREGMISPQLQMFAIEDYCKRRGYIIVKVLEDLDLSGRFWKRRQVEEGIAMIETDQADILVVWRWSRVSRNRLDWAIAVDRVESVGGTLESATEGFDTTTATGRFARGMLAEFAAFESDRIGDVWREVRDRRVRMGLTPAGHQQFGYRKVNGQYVVDRKTGPALAELYRRYNEGESFHSLTAWLHRRKLSAAGPPRPDSGWGHQTLARLMDRGFGAGLIIADGVSLPGAHAPIISEDVWQAYLQRRLVTRKMDRVNPESYLLNGMVFCVCGRRMAPCSGTKRKYMCRTHRGGTRAAKSVNEDRLHGLLYQWLTRLVHNSAYSGAARRDSRRRAAEGACEARALARHISSTTITDTLRDALDAAEARSMWRDPVEVAESLLEDWATLNDAVKRLRLAHVVEHVSIRSGHRSATLTVHTAWGTNSPITAESAHVNRCEMPTNWLDGNQALALAGVNRSTLRIWRERGLLPLTKPFEGVHYLYARTDLDRLLNAPRKGKLGIDLAATQAVIAAAADAPSTPQAGGPSR